MRIVELYGYSIREDGVILGRRGNPLSPSDNGRGYLIVSLLYNGRRIVKAVHRLLAEAFIPNPEGLSDVNHIDGNKRNNALSNLEWVTHGENIAHAFKHNLRNATGVNNARCLTDMETVLEICELLQQGKTPANVRDLGYNYSLARKIKSRQTWKHVSSNFIW